MVDSTAPTVSTRTPVPPTPSAVPSTSAIQTYDEAIHLNPQDSLAHHERGLVYADLRQYDRAIQDYDEAIRLDPRFTTAYNNRGVAFGNLGQHSRAIQDFDEAILL